MEPDIKRCSRCALSEAIPKIRFDSHGLCNFCRDETFLTVDQELIRVSTKKIEGLIENNRGAGEYDAVMCYSGGKDSTYTLLLAVEKYGLNVLSFTLDNGFISPTAFENINRVVDYLGVDQITIRPSFHFMREVIKASGLYDIYNPKFLVRISSICNSCISLVNVMALKLAIEKTAPFILAGFTLGQIPSRTIIYQNNYRFLQESRQAFINKLKKYVGDLVDRYYCISDEILDRVERYPYNMNLLCLEDIAEDEILKKVKAIGWIQPEDVDGCSSNCRLNVFNNFIHQKKFGYSPYEWELSHLVRNKQLSRVQAIDKLYDQPETQLDYVMSRVGIKAEDVERLKLLG